MKKNYDRWSELTSIGAYGPGGLNPFKWFPYIYNDLDTENEDIRRYKDRIRFCLKYGLIFLLAMLINSVILAFLIMLSKAKMPLR